MEEQRDLLKSAGHDYDGIKEYDNPLPRWWVYLFYGTVIFSFWYMAYYHAKGSELKKVRPGEEALAWSLSVLEKNTLEAEAALGAQQASSEPKDLNSLIGNPDAIARGKNLYAANCIACHGTEGQGLVGPNLVDEYWMHGYTPDDIRKAIALGFPEKGMVGWEAVLGPGKVNDLVTYVLSIEGNEVPAPKEPQGEKKGG